MERYNPNNQHMLWLISRGSVCNQNIETQLRFYGCESHPLLTTGRANGYLPMYFR